MANFKTSVDQNSILDILSLLFSMGYQETNAEDHVTEFLGDNTDIQTLGGQFYSEVKNIINHEVNKIANPITMTVTAINEAKKTVSAKRADGGKEWTNIFNPTIFNHLEVGDEIVVGFHNGQTSNAYVLFAKMQGKKDYQEKSILKDISKVKSLNENVIMLKDWMDEIVKVVFPDIITRDNEGNIIDVHLHPKRIEFNEDMKNWKNVKFEEM